MGISSTSIRHASGADPNDLDTGAGAAADYPLMWPVIAGGSSGIYAPPPENWWDGIVEAVLPVGLFNSSDSESRRVLVYETVWSSTGSGPHWHLLRDEPHVHFFAAIGFSASPPFPFSPPPPSPRWQWLSVWRAG